MKATLKNVISFYEFHHSLIRSCMISKDISKEIQPVKEIKEVKEMKERKPKLKFTEKVYIPQETYPSINFLGLIFGPKSKTLKEIETDSGCSIVIRGKGSVRNEKKHLLSSEDGPLHCLVSSNSKECIHKAEEIIKDIIHQAIKTPIEELELRRRQLKEVASIRNFKCQNCGSRGHIRHDCPLGDSLQSINSSNPLNPVNSVNPVNFFIWKFEFEFL